MNTQKMIPLVNIFGWEMQTMGLVLITGFFVFVFSALWQSKVCNHRIDNFKKYLLIIFLISILFAYIFYWIMHWEWFVLDWTILSPLRPSYSFFGLLVGFFSSLAYISHATAGRFYRQAEVFLVPFLLFAIILEIGLLFSGIAYGSPTTLGWGIDYSNYYDSPVFLSGALHPVPIYKIIFYIILGFVFEFTLRHRHSSKYLFYFFFFIFFAGNFILDFYRGDNVGVLFGIRLDQIASLAVVATSGIILYRSYYIDHHKYEK